MGVRTGVDICLNLWTHALMQDMSANRVRRPTNITLDPVLIERLDAWIRTQPYRLARSSVIEEAIVQFLDKQERGDG